MLAVVVVLGTIGVVFSRQQRQDELARTGGEPPVAPAEGKPGDHWHASLAFDVCGTMLPNITDEKDTQGIHTHGDGVVHVHPFVRAASGTNATLGKFADVVGLKLSEDSFQLPGDEKHKTGDKCGKKRGEVQFLVNGKAYEGDPRQDPPEGSTTDHDRPRAQGNEDPPGAGGSTRHAE